MIKAILFDFDGTITNSLKHHYYSFKKALAEFDKDLTDEQIVAAFYPSKEQELTFKKLGLNTNEFWKVHEKFWLETLKNLELHEHLSDVLEYLKREKIKLAIVSFAQSWQIQRDLDNLNIASYFNAVLGYDSASKPKPDPEIALKAMEKLGVKKEETVLIGDTHFDVLTGKNAGILTGLYMPEENRLYSDIDLYRSSNPDFEFESYLQLPEEIKRLQNMKEADWSPK